MDKSNKVVAWSAAQTEQELKRLVVHGVIGLYRSFEVTEIFGFRRGGVPTNFLTLAVAESAEPATNYTPEQLLLNAKPLVLKGTEWKVGVARYRVSIDAMLHSVGRFAQTGQWQSGQKPLQVGTLAAVAPQFVPADSYQEVPWNRVLKNNFWEGSHVLELFDTSKHDTQFMVAESRTLTALAALIRPYVPMGIDGLSDRLGNIVLQLPVTVLSTAPRSSADGSQSLTVAWNRKVPPRPVHISSEIYEDFTIEGFDSSQVSEGAATLQLHSPSGGARTHIWDDKNRVLLGATPVTAFITSVGLSIHAVGIGEPSAAREFLVPDNHEKMLPISLVLKLNAKPDIIGSTVDRPREPWRTNRVFKESLSAIQERKEFVQYGRVTDAGEREALEDIRWLLKEHGAHGAWLWDPFLSADDVLRTLFFCPYNGVELRALTAGHEASCSTGGDEPWKKLQAQRLETSKGNCHGLNLEFRIRSGEAGWSFHDRFIIFPRIDGPAVAWSLGTSVNSLGRQHHILQKVSNGELIANAFRDLWDKLEDIEHLVWKTL